MRAVQLPYKRHTISCMTCVYTVTTGGEYANVHSRMSIVSSVLALFPCEFLHSTYVSAAHSQCLSLTCIVHTSIHHFRGVMCSKCSQFTLSSPRMLRTTHMPATPNTDSLFTVHVIMSCFTYVPSGSMSAYTT